MHNTSFPKHHPKVVLTLFLILILISMLCQNLALQIANVCLATLYLVLVDRSRSTKNLLIFAAITGCLITIINPLFNGSGNGVLFTYFGGRNYTVEGIVLGLHTALMFMGVIIWFSCLNRSIDEDGLLYAFGRFASSITLVLTLSLRFIPRYREQAKSIIEARSALGLRDDRSGIRDKMHFAGDVISSLITQAMIGAIDTSTSMQSRGYGTGKRSHFRAYKLRMPDTLILLATLVCAIILAASLTLWTSQAPCSLPSAPIATLSTFAFIMICTIPSIAIFQERLSWRFSISRI